MKVRGELRGDPDNTLLELLTDDTTDNVLLNSEEHDAVDMISNSDVERAIGNRPVESVAKDDINFPYLEKAKSPPPVTTLGRGRGCGTGESQQKPNKSRRGNGRGHGHNSGRGSKFVHQQDRANPDHRYTRNVGRGRATDDFGMGSQQLGPRQPGSKNVNKLSREELNFLRKKSDDDGFTKQRKKGPSNTSTPRSNNRSSSRLSPEQSKGLEAIGLGPKSSFVSKVVSKHA